MGQQTCPSNMSHPAIEPDRVKKSKSRFEAERKIPSESEGKSSDFARYGMVVNLTHTKRLAIHAASQAQPAKDPIMTAIGTSI